MREKGRDESLMKIWMKRREENVDGVGKREKGEKGR